MCLFWLPALCSRIESSLDALIRAVKQQKMSSLEYKTQEERSSAPRRSNCQRNIHCNKPIIAEKNTRVNFTISFLYQSLHQTSTTASYFNRNNFCLSLFVLYHTFQSFRSITFTQLTENFAFNIHCTTCFYSRLKKVNYFSLFLTFSPDLYTTYPQTTR